MAPAGAIDSNETDFNIPAVSPANGKIYFTNGKIYFTNYIFKQTRFEGLV